MDGSPRRVMTEGRNLAVSFVKILLPRLDHIKRRVHRLVDSATGTLTRDQWMQLLEGEIRAAYEEAGASAFADAGDDEVQFWSMVAPDNECSPSRLDPYLRDVVAMFDYRDQGRASWNDFSDFLSECAVKGPVVPDEEDIHKYESHSLCPRPPRRIISIKWQPKESRFWILSEDEASRKDAMAAAAHQQQQRTNIEWMYRSSSGASNPRIPLVALPLALTAMEPLDHLGPNAVAVCSSDLHLRVYDLKHAGPEQTHSPARTVENYTLMRWNPHCQRLWCAKTTISTWSVSPRKGTRQPQLGFIQSTQPHQSTVTQLKFLSTDGSVLTCSMDRKVLLQDPERGVVVADFHGHSSAVADVDHSSALNLVVSCGFDHDVYVWPTHGERRRSGNALTVSPLAILRDPSTPHTPPYVAVHAIPGTPQLLSIDVTGMVKVWDLRTFSCCQTLDAAARNPTTPEQLVGSTLAWEIQGFVVHSPTVIRPVHYTSRYSNYVRETADDTIIGVLYSSSTDDLVSATQAHLQTWGIRTAVKSSEVRVMSESVGEVTAIGIDAMGRKVVLGHRGGTVTFYSASTVRQCGKRQLSDADIIDVAGYGSEGAAFAVDELGSCFCLSDDGDVMPTLKFERHRNAKFVRLSSLFRTIFVFHGDLIVHMYSLRAERTATPRLLQILHLAGLQSQLPPNPGSSATTPTADAWATKRGKYTTDVSAAQIVHIPGEDRTLLLVTADSTNHISLFGGRKIGSTVLEMALLGRWYYGSSDIVSLAVDWQVQCLVISNASSVIGVYDTSSWAMLVEEFNGGSETNPSPLHRRGSIRASVSRASLVILPHMGLLLVSCGERIIHVLPLALNVDSFGTLSLDRSAVKYTFADPEQFARDQRDALRQGAPGGEPASPRGGVLAVHRNHPEAPVEWSEGDPPHNNSTLQGLDQPKQSFLTEAFVDFKLPVTSTAAVTRTGSSSSLEESVVTPLKNNSRVTQYVSSSNDLVASSLVRSPPTALRRRGPPLRLSTSDASLPPRRTTVGIVQQHSTGEETLNREKVTSSQSATVSTPPVASSSRRERRERARKVEEALWLAARVPRDYPPPRPSPVEVCVDRLRNAETFPIHAGSTSVRPRGVLDELPPRAASAIDTALSRVGASQPSESVQRHRPLTDQHVEGLMEPKPKTHGPEARLPDMLSDERFLAGGAREVQRVVLPALKPRLHVFGRKPATDARRHLPSGVGIFFDC